MDGERRCGGSAFQTAGAATWKLRRPSCVLVEGTSMSWRSAERTKMCPARDASDWNADVVKQQLPIHLNHCFPLTALFTDLTLLGVIFLTNYGLDKSRLQSQSVYTDITVWRFGVAVTRWSRSTQLLYIEPG